jgi:NAD(P)-dependent dehydrogenase (short-subunit alcohol dehydrogenase family)
MTGKVLSRFGGKIAIVTGAGRGIGAATARRLAQEGASVVIAELNADTGAEMMDGGRTVLYHD